MGSGDWHSGLVGALCLLLLRFVDGLGLFCGLPLGFGEICRALRILVLISAREIAKARSHFLLDELLGLLLCVRLCLRLLL